MKAREFNWLPARGVKLLVLSDKPDGDIQMELREYMYELNGRVYFWDGGPSVPAYRVFHPGEQEHMDALRHNEAQVAARRQAEGIGQALAALAAASELT